MKLAPGEGSVRLQQTSGHSPTGRPILPAPDRESTRAPPRRRFWKDSRPRLGVPRGLNSLVSHGCPTNRAIAVSPDLLLERRSCVFGRPRQLQQPDHVVVASGEGGAAVGRKGYRHHHGGVS
jgi:hypothetical protein